MAREGIPDRVRSFITAHIDSVETLEVLLLLHRDDRPWTAAEIARELRSSPASVAMRLAHLVKRGLVGVREDGEPQYRCAPAEGPMVQDLATAYARRRVSVISLIYSKPSDQVTTFADAFRFRKGSE